MEEKNNILTREESVAISLKKMYDESEDKITADAILSRAFADRISVDSINQKVEAQMNSITAGIQNINPNFKEGSKNYSNVKKSIVDSMANYESVLIELSKFYDTKIEQLILRKVELESSLTGIITNDEYLYEKEKQKIEQKENDKVKNKITEGIKKVIQKLQGKTEKQPVDPILIETMMDGKDVEQEISQQMNKRVEKTKNESKENKEQLDKVEKEIRLINEEIGRLNKIKKESLLSAMEVGDKWIDVNVKKPKIFTKITRFFVSRFNTQKVVNQTIIEPLNQRIESFRNNELSSMKGE